MFKFNIIVCIKYGEIEVKKLLKWYYFYRNLIKKLLIFCVRGSSVCDVVFFFFGFVKDRINSNGGWDGYFG